MQLLILQLIDTCVIMDDTICQVDHQSLRFDLKEIKIRDDDTWYQAYNNKSLVRHPNQRTLAKVKVDTPEVWHLIR